LNGKRYIDLHSLNIVNFLGLEPSKKYQEEIDGWLFNVNEYIGEFYLDTNNMLAYTESNFEKLKISNTLSIEQLKYSELYNKLFFKVENSLNGLECVVSMGNDYLLEHIDVFANKQFEFILELYVALHIKNVISKFNVKRSFNHPFIFRIDLGDTSYDNAYHVIEEIRKINVEISEKIPKLFATFQVESSNIDRLMKNVHLSDFLRTLYNYEDLNALTEDLESLIDILSKFEKFD
jgi:hypothetical protein